MDRLPVFLKLAGRRCLIVGGGVVAERKSRLLLRTGADVTVLSPAITENLAAQVRNGELSHIEAHYLPNYLKNQFLVIAATDNAELNRQVGADAESAGCLSNVVDDTEGSQLYLPAIVDRSPVIVAIGTSGTAPVLARKLKSQIESLLPQRIGELASQAGRWRDLVKKRFSTSRDRRRFWQRFFDGPITEDLLAGRQARAEKAMRLELIGRGDVAELERGEGWIVGAGPGDPGLLTLRAQQLISQADVILYDRLVSRQVLDHARKEADFVFVGKQACKHAMPQEDINKLLVSLVRDGKRVCRLKGGDPFVFGRGGEEATALADAGLPFQIVPGISAALGCAAYAGIPLTLRGVSGSVTLATARLDDDLDPDWPELLTAGHTLSVYMGVGAVAAIASAARRHGVDMSLPAAIVENGTTAQQRTIFTTIGELEQEIERHAIRPPAMIYLGESIRAASKLQWFEGGQDTNDFPVDSFSQRATAEVG